MAYYARRVMEQPGYLDPVIQMNPAGETKQKTMKIVESHCVENVDYIKVLSTSFYISWICRQHNNEID